MHAFTSTIAFGVFLLAAGQDPAFERRAVALAQQTPVSQHDAALPARPFGTWFNQLVGPQAGVSWHLTECGEQPGGAYEREADVPACIEVSAILPNDRKVVAQFLVGSFKRGLADKAKFHFAALEDGTQLHSVPRLSELPQLIRRPFPRVRLRPVTLPNGRLRRPSPALYVAAPPLLNLPPIGAGLEAPPPPRGPLRISKGVTMGDAITKVMPAYPSLAKQVNAYGEVQVEIEIDETGRVIDAKAVSGHSTLRGAAEDAARKWVFNPALLNGVPTRSKGTLTFVFTRPQ